MSQTERTARPSVLLVDDDAALLQALKQHLQDAGFGVDTSRDARAALQQLKDNEYDALVIDVLLPGMGGLELLREVRRVDRDLPVVLMTAHPSLSTAAEAIEHGVFRYLRKPVPVESLIDVVGRAAQLNGLGRAKREALTALGTGTGEGSLRPGLEASFEQALSSLWIAFQPILRVSDRSLFGYEALLRCREPSLPNPGAVLDAAERLGQLDRLGRAIRRQAVELLGEADPAWLLFLNLHPQDLMDSDLVDPAATHFQIADRIVLEITERATLDQVPDLSRTLGALREAGCRLAVDDLGAGYAGLTSFVQLEPDIVKLDMSLVRDVDRSALKQKLVRSMTSVCKDMGMLVVGEGVETAEERDALVELGCDLLQGYHFGKPCAAFEQPRW